MNSTGFVFVEGKGWWHGSCWDRMHKKRLHDSDGEEPFSGSFVELLPSPEHQGYDEGSELAMDPSVYVVDEDAFIEWRRSQGPEDEYEVEQFRCRGCGKLIKAGASVDKEPSKGEAPQGPGSGWSPLPTASGPQNRSRPGT